MTERPPFDPVKGAWLLLLLMVAAVFLNSAFIFVGCAIFHEPSICARTGNNLTDVALELIAAVGLLIGTRR